MEKKAVRVNLKTLFNGEVTAYIPANKIHALVEHRAPAELIRIRVGVDGTEVLEPVGTAYRSKSGRALMIKSAWFAGGEVMAPWAKFCALLEGTVKKARLALPEDVYRPAPAARESTITDGLERGF